MVQNPATMNLCSKCYRESQVAVGKQQEQTGSASKPACMSQDPLPDKDIALKNPSGQSIVQSESIASEPSDISVQDASVAADRSAEQGKPVQMNRKRCFCCNKKVGLLGFECRCGYVYCSSHRHQDDHNCTFDYAAFDRERLAKANQKVEAVKVEKL